MTGRTTKAGISKRADKLTLNTRQEIQEMSTISKRVEKWSCARLVGECWLRCVPV